MTTAKRHMAALRTPEYVPGWPFLAISYMIWGAASTRWFIEYQEDQLGSGAAVSGILLGYGVLLGLETIITRRHVSIAYLYFAAQVMLALAAMMFYRELDFFALLLVPLAGQAMFVFRERVAVALVGVMLMATLLGQIDQFGFPGGLPFFLLYGAGIVFVTVFSATTIRSEANATTAEQLVTKLEDANARLSAYIHQADELAAAQERNRLARELHDTVAQALYGIALQAEAGRRSLDQGQSDIASGSLEEISANAQLAFKETRLLIFALRPTELEEIGLAGSIQSRLDAVERRSGIEVKTAVDDLHGLSEETELGLFRIAQEALNNAMRHSNCTGIEVKLEHAGDKILLSVADNGVGFNNTGTAGFGLAGMKERALGMGGTCSITAGEHGGTVVVAEVPA